VIERYKIFFKIRQLTQEGLHVRSCFSRDTRPSCC